MNAKVIFGVLLVMTAMLCVMPVSAATQTFLVKSADKGIQSSFTMTIAPGDTVFPLMVLGDNEQTGNSVTVLSNVPWSIKAKDTMIGSKTVGSDGRMVALVTSTGAMGAPLTNPLSLKFNGGSYVALSTTPAAETTFATGSNGDTTAPITFKQTIAPTDAVLPTGSVYQMELMVTGAATP